MNELEIKLQNQVDHIFGITWVGLEPQKMLLKSGLLRILNILFKSLNLTKITKDKYQLNNNPLECALSLEP